VNPYVNSPRYTEICNKTKRAKPMKERPIKIHHSGLFLSIFLLSGCASDPINIAPSPPPKYEMLGHATGKACGSIGLAWPQYNFIPIMLNSRVERAYKNALDSVPSSTSLINVEMEEDWYWWLLGTARCTTISGDAIKEAVR
jgi:hypothetical protein